MRYFNALLFLHVVHSCFSQENILKQYVDLLEVKIDTIYVHYEDKGGKSDCFFFTKDITFDRMKPNNTLDIPKLSFDKEGFLISQVFVNLSEDTLVLGRITSVGADFPSFHVRQNRAFIVLHPKEKKKLFYHIKPKLVKSYETAFQFKFGALKSDNICFLELVLKGEISPSCTDTIQSDTIFLSKNLIDLKFFLPRNDWSRDNLVIRHIITNPTEYTMELSPIKENQHISVSSSRSIKPNEYIELFIFIASEYEYRENIQVKFIVTITGEEKKHIDSRVIQFSYDNER